MAVLQAVVSEYVGTCCPVASKTIVNNYDLGVSPATVRGELSRLELTGHLAQPHVSAGRVPTNLGYRAAVNDRLAHGTIASVRAPSVSADTTRDAVRQIARAIADMTHCLAIISVPVSPEARVVRLNLVPTQPGCVVVVIVCDDGRVESRELFIDGLTTQDVVDMEEVISALVIGRDVRSLDSDRLLEGRGWRDEARRIIGLIASVLVRVDDVPRASAGLSYLLQQPELAEGERVRSAAGTLGDGDVDFDLLLSHERGGLAISIGDEMPDVRLRGLSFVGKRYTAGAGSGFVACVGPTRMDYVTTIGAVQAAALQASAVFSELAS